jgi:hypothetical protein
MWTGFRMLSFAALSTVSIPSTTITTKKKWYYIRERESAPEAETPCPIRDRYSLCGQAEIYDRKISDAMWNEE